jgi:hypothetical protein
VPARLPGTGKARPSGKKRARASAWRKKQLEAGTAQGEEPQVVLRSRSDQARADGKAKKWGPGVQKVLPPWAAQAKSSGGHFIHRRRPREGAEQR